MTEVEVAVIRGGCEIARIRRPLRSLDGRPAITYRGRLWPLEHGREVYLDGRPRSPAVPHSGTEVPVQSATEVQLTPPVFDGWDDLQNDVITASAGERLLVSAGPGTGKTAVACARVALSTAEENPATGRRKSLPLWGWD